MNFLIYADGGCSGNKRDSGCIGAYAFIIMDVGKNIIYHECNRVENTTNNRMEMIAVIKGIETLLKTYINDPKFHECVVYSDSKYVVDNFNDYIYKWCSNHWKKRSGGQIINLDLWKQLWDLYVQFKSFKLCWVKGHSTNKFNLEVDEMVHNVLYPHSKGD